MSGNEGRARLGGRVCVVTGAARGIGRAAAIVLAREGAAAVVGIDVAGAVSGTLDVTPATADELEQTGRLVEAEGAGWLSLRLDQRDGEAVRNAAAAVEARFGGADVVFANAGIQAFKPILEMEPADWQDTIDVNLTGTFHVVRHFGPLLKRRGGGRVIVTSSTQGRHGTKFGSAYSASKWGLIGLAKSAALEWGADNITVNVLVPGLIDTPLTRHRDRYAQAAGDLKSDASTEELEQQAEQAMRAKTPLGVPWIDPADIAPTVAFLASDAARMVSGACFDVTGGDSANNV